MWLIASRALLLYIAVVRFRIWAALVVGAIVAGLLCAQVSEEQESRRDQSDQRETHAAPSPKSKKSPSPAAKEAKGKSTKKHRPSATPEKTPKAIPRAKPVGEELEKSAAAEETPEPTPRETPEHSASPKSKRHHTLTPKTKSAKKKSKETARKTRKTTKPAQTEEETPKPRKTPSPRAEEEHVAQKLTPSPVRAVAVPTPAPCPTPKGFVSEKISHAVPADQRAQVLVEKSGIEEDQGFEPPPSPPPRRSGFWPWSRQTNYRYLTRSVIDAIRRAPVKRRRWQFIVVHNSGTRQGNAHVFDYYHRHVRRMQNGLAYHFVIGNGTSTGNGQIEVGDRWRRQINGGHVHSDYLNNISLGICLVGDFNRDQPTRAQLDACDELIRYLRERCGGTGRGDIPVKPHREINPPRWPTDCPGDVFPYSWFRRF